MLRRVEKATPAERWGRKSADLRRTQKEDGRVAYQGRSAKAVNGKEDIMKTLKRFNRSIISTVSAAALVIGGGFWQVAAAGEMYLGTATTCAIDLSNVTEETMPNGFTYTSGVVMHVRVATGHELMNGPVAVTSHSKLKTTPKGKVTGWYWGESTMVPDQVAGVGTLEEIFKFKAKDASEISGTFYGTGDFEGVTVEFAETFDPQIPQEYCDEYPPCVAAGTCIPVHPDSPEGFNMPYVTRFEGVVFGYED
mgnify:FL=1